MHGVNAGGGGGFGLTFGTDKALGKTGKKPGNFKPRPWGDTINLPKPPLGKVGQTPSGAGGRLNIVG